MVLKVRGNIKNGSILYCTQFIREYKWRVE